MLYHKPLFLLKLFEVALVAADLVPRRRCRKLSAPANSHHFWLPCCSGLMTRLYPDASARGGKYAGG
jgi:hypothetical protein